MASIGGYRSPVNLGLGRVPITQDPELFDEFTDVYNAIHLLNEYLDTLRTVASGGGSGQTPAETMPFNRFFVGKALVNIVGGQLVCPSPVSGENGMVLGPLPDGYDTDLPNANFVGVALTDAAAGEEFRVGVGPAVLEVPGTISGQVVWAYSALNTAGTRQNAGNGIIYASKPPVKSFTSGAATVYTYPLKAGIAITDGFVMFGRFLRTPFPTT